jgi:AAA domain/DnaB-like helicase N terminal domain
VSAAAVNLEAEESVLGAMMISGALIPPVLEDVGLQAEDFYRDGHRAIFGAIASLAGNGSPVDVLTVSEELAGAGELEAAGGRDLLAMLAAKVPAPGHARYHAEIVQRAARVRRVHELGSRLRAVSDGNGDAIRILEEVDRLLGQDLDASLADQRSSLRVLDVGEMVVSLPPAVPWVIEGIAVEGCLTLLSGKEGEGKSLLAMSLAVGVGLGEDVAGVPCTQRKVLIVDAENGKYEIHRRVHTLGLPAEGVAVVEADGYNLGRDLAALEELIDKFDPGLLILDSFRSLWPAGEENDSAAVSAVLDPLRNMLRRRRVAGILLHHVSRAGNDYRGTSAIGAAIELGFNLKRIPEDPESRDRRRLRCFKCRPAPEPHDRWLRLHVERGQVFVDSTDPFEGEAEEKPAAPARAELAPRMLAAAVEPLSWPDLARAIDRGPKDGTARRLRDDLLDKGELMRLDDGRLQGCQGAKPLGEWHDGTLSEAEEGGP